jgi:hypothetical protein
MISGIRSLAATHEQFIVGWTGDIQSPTPGERIPVDHISSADKAALDDALMTFQPSEADPDDDKKTTYVPVWLDNDIAHGHYDGYCKQSEYGSFYLHFSSVPLVLGSLSNSSLSAMRALVSIIFIPLRSYPHSQLLEQHDVFCRCLYCFYVCLCPPIMSLPDTRLLA